MLAVCSRVERCARRVPNVGRLEMGHSAARVRIPDYTVSFTQGDYRTRVELRPPKLPWPLVYYFALVVNERGEALYVLEGPGDTPAAPEIDAGTAMEAAEHYRQHAGDYELVAMHLCNPTPENRLTAAEVYAARILRLRRLRRTEEDRLRVRDEYRSCVDREGRRHGAIQAVAIKLHLDRKAVRRALEDCVRRGEMADAELPPRRRRSSEQTLRVRPETS
jgi:hypothetical protein